MPSHLSTCPVRSPRPRRPRIRLFSTPPSCSATPRAAPPVGRVSMRHLPRTTRPPHSRPFPPPWCDQMPRSPPALRPRCSSASHRCGQGPGQTPLPPANPLLTAECAQPAPNTARVAEEQAPAAPGATPMATKEPRRRHHHHHPRTLRHERSRPKETPPADGGSTPGSNPRSTASPCAPARAGGPLQAASLLTPSSLLQCPLQRPRRCAGTRSTCPSSSTARCWSTRRCGSRCVTGARQQEGPAHNAHSPPPPNAGPRLQEGARHRAGDAEPQLRRRQGGL